MGHASLGRVVDMNRRNFLKRMGIGTVGLLGVAAVPSLLASPSLPAVLTPQVPATSYSTYVMGADSCLSVKTLRECVESLKGLDVKPRGSKNAFYGYVHPNVIADILTPPVRYKWTVAAFSRS